MILKDCKVAFFGWEDLTESTKKLFRKEKVDGSALIEIDLNDLDYVARKHLEKSEIAIFKYGINNQLLKTKY